MVFATKEMLDEMHEKTKKDFEANPEKYLRRYKGWFGFPGTTAAWNTADARIAAATGPATGCAEQMSQTTPNGRVSRTPPVRFAHFSPLPGINSNLSGRVGSARWVVE